jgi:hypothetical protein
MADILMGAGIVLLILLVLVGSMCAEYFINHSKRLNKDN